MQVFSPVSDGDDITLSLTGGSVLPESKLSAKLSPGGPGGRKRAAKRPLSKDSSASQLATSRNHHLDFIGKRVSAGGATTKHAAARSKISVDLDCVAISLQHGEGDEAGFLSRCGTLNRRDTCGPLVAPETDGTASAGADRRMLPLGAGAYVSADFASKWGVDGEEVKEDELEVEEEESLAQRASVLPPARPDFYNPILQLPNEFQGSAAGAARNSWARSRPGVQTILHRRGSALPPTSAVTTPPRLTSHPSPAKGGGAGLVNYEFVTDAQGRLQIERKHAGTGAKGRRA